MLSCVLNYTAKVFSIYHIIACSLVTIIMYSTIGIHCINCSLKKEENVNYKTKLFTFMHGARTKHMIVTAGHHISISQRAT